MAKRIISFFTALSMTVILFAGMPISISAATIVANGTCGADGNEANITWSLDSDGVFTISGTGRMESWTSYGVYPPWQWYGGSIKTIKIIGIENIGDYAFDLYSDSITSVSIPDSVTEIGKEVFGDCVSLTEINIPDSVTKIGINAFKGCTSLETIVIPKNVTVIERGVFNNCTSLNSVKIPSGVTRIEDYVFDGCTSLTEIDIPDTVTEIEPCAFAGSGFTSIPKLPSGITSISDGMFEQCQNLTSVRIPDNITSIGEIAFGLCPNLTSVIIPNSVDSIGAIAFVGCENLEYVLYPANAELGENVFAGYDGNDFTDSTITQLKYEASGDKRKVTEIILGSGKTDVTITDDMNINYVAEAARATVSQVGHTHIPAEGICNICDKENHIHTFSPNWSSNDTHHWHECSCGEKSEFTNHIPSDWIVETPATTNLEGVQIKKCTVCGIELNRTAINKLPNIGNTQENVLDTAGTNVRLVQDNTLIENVLTSEDKTDIENGSSFEIVLEVTDIWDSVSTDDVTAASSALYSDEKIGIYIDLSLFKVKDNIEKSPIYNTGGQIGITLTIPESIYTSDRTYSIIRVHNGTAENLGGTYDKANRKLTFYTDKFSTYAIAYAASNDSADKPSVPSTPPTGDITPVSPSISAVTTTVTETTSKKEYKVISNESFIKNVSSLGGIYEKEESDTNIHYVLIFAAIAGIAVLATKKRFCKKI